MIEVMKKSHGIVVMIMAFSVACHAEQDLTSSHPIDVAIISFGYRGGSVFEILPQLTISGPPNAVAIDELNRRYNRTFNFTYIDSGCAACLAAAPFGKPNQVLADFYYRVWRPGTVVLFLIAGSGSGMAIWLARNAVYCNIKIFRSSVLIWRCPQWSHT